MLWKAGQSELSPHLACERARGWIRAGSMGSGRQTTEPPPSSRASTIRPQPRGTGPVRIRQTSSKHLGKAVDEPVEILFARALGLDLSDRVDHRRMMHSTEVAPDLGQGLV